MAITVNYQAVKVLLDKSDPELLADIPGFALYWQDQNPREAAATLMARADQVFQVDENKLLSSLGRLSGVAIEQQLVRHLPPDRYPDFNIFFCPRW